MSSHRLGDSEPRWTTNFGHAREGAGDGRGEKILPEVYRLRPAR